MAVVSSRLALFVLLAGCRFDPSGVQAAGDRRPWPKTEPAQDSSRGEPLLPLDGPSIERARTPDRIQVDHPRSADAGRCGGGCPPGNVCCNKGAGWTCVSIASTASCLCDAKTGAPCTGTSFPVCCDTGGGARCAATAMSCTCDPATAGSPCVAPFPLCCDKGAGPRCFLAGETSGCACKDASTCQGSLYPYCCDRGLGQGGKCSNSTHYCVCDPATGAPCTNSDCRECHWENGYNGCHGCW